LKSTTTSKNRREPLTGPWIGRCSFCFRRS